MTKKISQLIWTLFKGFKTSKRDLKVLLNLRQSIWKLDIQYQQLLLKMKRSKARYLDFISHNKDLQYVQGQSFTVKCHILRSYPFWVAFVDICVAYFVFKEYTKHLAENIDPLTLALLIALGIVIIEICVGLFKEKILKSISKSDQRINNFFQSPKGLLALCMFLLGILLLLVVPFISTSEYYAQKSITDILMYHGEITKEQALQQITGLKIKYIGLSILSFITHFCLMFNFNAIIDSYAFFLVKKKWETSLRSVEAHYLEKENLELRLVDTLVRYDNLTYLFIQKYGSENIPNEQFSQAIDKIYNQVNSSNFNKS